jgi:hypothetical protein
MFDSVSSGHCLENPPHPRRAIARPWEVLWPDGTLLGILPDEEPYERGFWPSRIDGKPQYAI